jgi:hypothetical protein
MIYVTPAYSGKAEPKTVVSLFMKEKLQRNTPFDRLIPPLGNQKRRGTGNLLEEKVVNLHQPIRHRAKPANHNN